MRRREFITLIGGAAAAVPLAARAQQTGVPVIGFLDAGFAAERTSMVAAFKRGLGEEGYVEGQNVAIEFRWADGKYDRLPDLAFDLIRHPVSVIAAPGTTAAATAAKAATTTIPIVFFAASDPVRLGLVASLGRPGGNATGVNFLYAEVAAKRMAMLRELVPAAVRIAVLVNPTDSANASTVSDVQTAANGQQILVLNAATAREIDAAFATLVHDRADALFVVQGAFFNTRRVQLAVLAARHAVPTMYSNRDYVEAGGLMSYGANLSEAHRQVGRYTGRILKGAKAAELPVLQATKFELVINLNTAKALGIEIPGSILARADEVIE
jgi:putative tryptophan/tyrosine transport system substrate-binding protein